MYCQSSEPLSHREKLEDGNRQDGRHFSQEMLYFLGQGNLSGDSWVRSEYKYMCEKVSSQGERPCCIGFGSLTLVPAQHVRWPDCRQPGMVVVLSVQHSHLLHAPLVAKELQRRSTWERSALYFLHNAKKQPKELVDLSWCCALLRCPRCPGHLFPGLAPPLVLLLTWCHQHHPGPAGQQTLLGLLAYQQPSEPLAHLDPFQSHCPGGVRGQGSFPAVSWFLVGFTAEPMHPQSWLTLLAGSDCTVLELGDWQGVWKAARILHSSIYKGTERENIHLL